MHSNSWPISLTLWLLLGLLNALYIFAACKTKRRARLWPSVRIVSFTVGTVLLMLTFLPSLVMWAHHDIRGHMVQHLLLGMFAPLAWVLASPMTLLLRSVPAHNARFLCRILRSRFFLAVSHPFTALVLNIGGMYLLYITPLYLISLNDIRVHTMIHVHFLLAGYLYCWSIAGCEASARRASFRTRLIALFIGIAAHTYLAKLMYIYLRPSVPGYSEEALRAAAKIMYYGGDLAELLLAVALFYGWQKTLGCMRRSAVRIQDITI